MQLTHKTALVVGGGTGIGAAVALALAKDGCRVAVGGRRQEVLDELAASYKGEPPLQTHRVDVADRDSVDALISWTEKEIGPLDIFVNSAGINVPNRSMADLSPEDWDRVIAVNATGAYNCLHALLPKLRARRDGLIVHISSVAGKRAQLVGGVAYNASKFAMSALGGTVALEELERGIRVTTIFPGEVETPILDQRPQPVSAEHRARILQPEDVAAAVLMVARLPQRAHIPELIIKPTSQPYA